MAPGSTGVAAILVEDSGEKSITLAATANDSWTPDYAAGLADAIAAAPPEAIVAADLDVTTSALREALHLAVARGLTVVLDPSPAERVTPELWACVDHGRDPLFDLSLVGRGRLRSLTVLVRPRHGPIPTNDGSSPRNCGYAGRWNRAFIRRAMAVDREELVLSKRERRWLAELEAGRRQRTASSIIGSEDRTEDKSRPVGRARFLAHDRR